MKTKISILFILALAVPKVFGALHVYDDDLYYHPKYETKHNETVHRPESTTAQTSLANENASVVNPLAMDVDAYNRRPSHQKEALAANYNEDLLSDSVLISRDEYEDFQYCERIRRFHNNEFTTHITEDGYVNIYIEDGANVDIYYMDDYYWNSWMSPWYFDVYYRPYYYGWGYHGYYGFRSPWRHSSWYYGHYDPWYYSWYSPWYYSWGWDYYHYGYHPYYYSPYTAWGYPSNIKAPRKPINTRTALATRNDVNSRGGVPVNSRQAVGSGETSGRSGTRSAVYNDFSRSETIASSRTVNTRGDNLTRGASSSRSTNASVRSGSSGTRSAINPQNSTNRNAAGVNNTVGTRQESTTRSTSTAANTRAGTVSTPSSTRSTATSSSSRSTSTSNTRSATSSASTSSSSSSSYSTPSSSGSSSLSSGSSSSRSSAGASSGASAAGRSSSGSTGRR